MKSFIYLLLFIISSFTAFSQEEGGCDLYRQIDLQEIPNNTPKKLRIGKNNIRQGNITIPVVFHILHECGEENISDTQIESALADWNKDINNLNDDRLQEGDPFYEDAASLDITLQLANKDIQGNPTTGINRYKWVTGYNRKDMIQLAAINYPRSTYLNVFVIKRLNGASGYSYYPSQMDSEQQAPIDGIVIVYRYVGNTETAIPSSTNKGNNGRNHILTHELGHFLGLAHTWGDDTRNNRLKFLRPGSSDNCRFDDNIRDTPNCIGSSRIVYPDDRQAGEIAEKSGCNRPANIYNTMDYGCEIMFTNDQVKYMREILSSPIAQRNLLGTPSNNKLAFSEDNNPILLLSQNFTEGHKNEKYSNIDIALTGGCNPLFTTDASKYIRIEGAKGNAILKGNKITVSIENPYDEKIKILFADNAFLDEAPIQKELIINVVTKEPLKLYYVDYKDDVIVSYNKHFNQDAFRSHILGYLGIVVDKEKHERFLLYSESSNEVQVYANDKNEVLSTDMIPAFPLYRTVTSGLGSQALKFNPKDWADKRTFIYIRYKAGCNNTDWFYAYAEISMTADAKIMQVHNMGYYNKEGLKVDIKQRDRCVTTIDRNDIRKILKVDIDGVINESNAGGFENFTNSSFAFTTTTGQKHHLKFTQSSRSSNPTIWEIRIDFNKDGFFDGPDELIVKSNKFRRTFNKKNFVLVEKEVAPGTYQLLIANNKRDNELCTNWKDGSIHLYNLQII